MTCCCEKTESALEKLSRLEPEKTASLNAFLDQLPIGKDVESNRAHLIVALHQAQGIFGYLPSEVQQIIAERLKLTRSEIYGVISFYSYFTDQPIGRFKISICCGTACFVKGANKIVEQFSRELGIKEGETTPDGRFFLGILRCVGACSLAPVVMVNERVYGNVTPTMVAKIIADCKD